MLGYSFLIGVSKTVMVIRQRQTEGERVRDMEKEKRQKCL